MEAFTVRMGLIDTNLYSAKGLVEFYKTELSKAGFTTSQMPAVVWPKPTIQILVNEPFQGARTIKFALPVFGEFEQTRDTRVPYADDPAKLADKGIALATVFTWNLCSVLPTEEALGKLRDIFRRLRVDGGMKLSPKVSLWKDAPDKLSGYPDKLSDPCQVRPESVKRKNQTGLLTFFLGIGASLLSRGKF